MDTSGRALLLYWTVYALDFCTSALFIALGYAAAETNSFQRALLTSPGPGALLLWAVNQNVWLVLGAVGVVACFVPKARTWWPYLGPLLLLFSFVRVYGVAANLEFTLQATLGVSFSTPGFYLLLSLPAIAALRHELWGGARTLAKMISWPVR